MTSAGPRHGRLARSVTSASLACMAAMIALTASGGLLAGGPPGGPAGPGSAYPTPVRIAAVGSSVPTPAASPGVLEPGDPRSEGEGPGLRGSPIEIAAGVVLLGLLAAGTALLYARLARRD